MKVGNGSVCIGKHLVRNLNHKFSRSQYFAICLGLVALCTFALVPSASADFDRIFFSVNGDTTQTSMTQGDLFGFGSNCDSGSTINWEIWFDVNANSTIERETDIMITSENITDGDPLTEEDPILDGLVMALPFPLFGEPGTYLFKATDILADSSLERTATMIAMSSPPNQLTGQIILPSVTPPNSLLANRLVFAESETGDEGAFLAITNNMGMYSMNVGASGTGVEFYMEPSTVPGYVTPMYISAVASGVVSGNDFTYEAATDSIWGFVKDELDALIPFETEVEMSSGVVNDRFGSTSNGRFVVYFKADDPDVWQLSLDSRISPLYLDPDGIEIDRSSMTNYQQDLVLISTDTVIYARITENGGAPSQHYCINAYSPSLGAGAEAVTDLVGPDYMAELHVSSMDASGWEVYVNVWDDEFAIPAGLIPGENGAFDVSPGDTVDLTLIDGQLLSGTITQDPEDAPINWDDVYVSAGLSGNNPDGAGYYEVYVDTGLQYVGVYADGYITFPAWRSLQVSGDVSGLDFTINETHCRVSGSLVNVPLPLDASWYTVVAQTGTNETDGYIASAQVDSVTGTFELYLCDGDWELLPPCCFDGLLQPANLELTIGEAPDTVKTADLVYTSESCCIGDRGNVMLEPNCEPANQVVDIQDLQFLIEHLFLSFAPICCLEEADIGPLNAPDGAVDILDLQLMIEYLFLTFDPPHSCP